MEQLGFDLIVLHSKCLQKIVRRLSPKYLARHSPPISRSLPHFLYKHKCIKIVSNCIKQRKLYKYIYFCSSLPPLPDLACHSPRSRSPPSPFSLIQTEAKCINCVSVCIKREKIVYTHASIYIFVLYTYNYTINISLPNFFCLFLYLVLYNFQIVSNFSLSRFIQFDSIVYSLSRLFCLSLFLILYKFKLYIIVLYTYDNRFHFVHFIFIQFSAQVSFSFLFYTLRFIQFASTVYVQRIIHTVSMFAMERN